jgi:hypothetical protein
MTEDTAQSGISNHDYCVRLLSDMHELFDGVKEHAHVAHKLMFYLAFITSLPVSASRDLIRAVELWQIKHCSVPEKFDVPQLPRIEPRVLVEEI